MTLEMIETHQDILVDRDALLARTAELNRALENIHRATGSSRRNLAHIAMPTQDVPTKKADSTRKLDTGIVQTKTNPNSNEKASSHSYRPASDLSQLVAAHAHRKRVIQPLNKKDTVAFKLDYEALHSEDQRVRPGEIVTPQTREETEPKKPETITPEERARAIEATYILPPDSRAAVKAARRGKAVLTHGFIEKRSASVLPEDMHESHATSINNDDKALAASIKDQIARVQGLAKSGDEVRLQLSTESTSVQPGVPIAQGARA